MTTKRPTWPKCKRVVSQKLFQQQLCDKKQLTIAWRKLVRVSKKGMNTEAQCFVIVEGTHFSPSASLSCHVECEKKRESIAPSIQNLKGQACCLNQHWIWFFHKFTCNHHFWNTCLWRWVSSRWPCPPVASLKHPVIFRWSHVWLKCCCSCTGRQTSHGCLVSQQTAKTKGIWGTSTFDKPCMLAMQVQCKKSDSDSFTFDAFMVPCSTDVFFTWWFALDSSSPCLSMFLPQFGFPTHLSTQSSHRISDFGALFPSHSFLSSILQLSRSTFGCSAGLAVNAA